jgi:hypothetical protein
MKSNKLTVSVENDMEIPMPNHKPSIATAAKKIFAGQFLANRYCIGAHFIVRTNYVFGLNGFTTPCMVVFDLALADIS